MRDLEVLRKDPHINRLFSTETYRISEHDLHRMIASVEEANGVFEFFVLRNWPGRPATLCGVPVEYQDDVGKYEAFGGQWTPCSYAGKVQSAGFVQLNANWRQVLCDLSPTGKKT